MTFSDHAALAIHNRDLIDNLRKTNIELKKRIHELSSLHEISKVLLSARTEKNLFDSVVHILVNELEVEKSSILIYNDDEAALEIVSYYGLPKEIIKKKYVNMTKSLAGLAFRENKTIFETDIDDSVYGPFSNPNRYTTGSFIIEPLAIANKPFGLVCVGDKIDGTRLEDDDAQLVSTIAAQIIKGYESLILNREMIAKKAAEKEIEVASNIQQNILPKQAAQSQNSEIGVKSVPAKIMGGDFYDYYQKDEDHCIFLVADVSGKSLPAAIFMAVSASIIRTIFRTTMKETGKPQEILDKANELIYENSESGMFVTTFLVNFDNKSGIAKFASAGHNEQFVYRKQENQFEFLKGKGSPLGVIPAKIHGPFGGGEVKLEPGDILTLYTDGVIEAINELKEEFGLSRFQNIIKESCNANPKEIVQQVYREVVEFAGNEPQFDDFTLFLLKRI
jgi:sigma-B regulation protein RsbU (phosphoserine phosphatase)